MNKPRRKRGTRPSYPPVANRVDKSTCYATAECRRYWSAALTVDLNARLMHLTGGGDHNTLREKVIAELAAMRQKGLL